MHEWLEDKRRWAKGIEVSADLLDMTAVGMRRYCHKARYVMRYWNVFACK